MKKDYSFLDINRSLPIVFFAIFMTIFFLAFMVYQPYILAFFIAGIFYIIFRKPYELVLKFFKNRSLLASSLMTVLVILAIILPLVYILIALVEEIVLAIDSVKKLATTENIQLLTEKLKWLKSLFNLSDQNIIDLQNKLIASLQDLTVPILRQGGSILLGLFSVTTNFTLAMIILFFLFKNGRELPGIVYRNLPFPDDLEEKIGTRLAQVLDAVVKGNLLIALAQGFMIGILFFIFGLPTPILYGALAAFFALIPVIGTMIVWLPGSIYLFITGSPTSAFILGGLAFPTYFLLENLLKPWLLDRKLNLHPLFLFLAIIGGLSQFGIKGLILGPLIVTGFVTVWQVISVWNTENAVAQK